MLIDPIITEWVRHPRISDRLIAQGAEGVTRPGAPEVGAPGAVVAWRVGVRGALAMKNASLSMSCMRCGITGVHRIMVAVRQYSTQRKKVEERGEKIAGSTIFNPLSSFCRRSVNGLRLA
jgi:hypothetical protein